MLGASGVVTLYMYIMCVFWIFSFPFCLFSSFFLTVCLCFVGFYENNSVFLRVRVIAMTSNIKHVTS